MTADPLNIASPLAGPSPKPDDGQAWFCLRTHPKHEHIATAHLRQLSQVEVCFPRIRFRRPTQQGPVWVTEPMFPNYLFARFNRELLQRHIQHLPGISGLVQFGEIVPTIPEEIISDLRREFGPQELMLSEPKWTPGDRVLISGGCFDGWKGTVAGVLPAKARLQILLDMLGRLATVEFEMDAVVPELPARLAA